MTNGEMCANAIKTFVNLMVGAHETGFVNKNNPTIAEIHQVAKNHIQNAHGITTPNIVEEFGIDVAVSCGMPEEDAIKLEENSVKQSQGGE